tara:strand:- start:27 stop:764 length:738 start_codon:yes stop_codon:yes gene_type:complete
MAYTRRLQENDLLKWRVENGLQEWQGNSERPVEANLGDAPDNSSPQPIKDICSYLYHTQETAAAAKELDDIGQQCKQLPQLQTFSDPEDLEEFINLGKRITELWYECDMKRLHVLRERIWRQLEPPEQEANPQSSRDVPVDNCHWDGEKIERVKNFPKHLRQAYRSYMSVPPEIRNGTYEEAYKWIAEESKCSEFTVSELFGYKLPAPDTWEKYVRKVLSELGESKNQPRGGRPHGSSVVRQDEI